jgi:hypothetical protein
VPPSGKRSRPKRAESAQNQEPIDLSNQILDLTKSIHAFTSPGSEAVASNSSRT